MIESLTLANTATFTGDPQAITELRSLNYLFGANATGKTTISRVIADPSRYPECSVVWKDGRPLEPMVLNRDFVERNFGQLKGVFTLGEEQRDALAKIAAAKQELDGEQAKLARLTEDLQGLHGEGGKKQELAQLETQFRDTCWAAKQRHDQRLQGAFTGYRHSAEKFKAKILEESRQNTASLRPVAELEKRAETAFGPTPTEEPLIAAPSTSAVLAHETNEILSKRVMGNDDVDIAAMIRKLGNSDWVRQGRTFYEVNEGLCPFCQQAAPESLATSLAEYFDEAFAADSSAIEGLCADYSAAASGVQAEVRSILAAPSRFLDASELRAQSALLHQAVDSNRLLLENKKREPSRAIRLNSLSDVCRAIQGLVDAANGKAKEHNRAVENLALERRELTAQVWRLVLKELAADLAPYRQKKDALEKAIQGITRSIKDANARVTAKQGEIGELERHVTSIKPTVTAINGILARFGFDSFVLAMGPDGRSYRLLRCNGDDASETLSEGERSFVVFLYFYHLLRGSLLESGITTDRVVVFDDPVSSLDSDVLFIVSSLIREVCRAVLEKRGSVKQVFVLTHNIYFHKEVTFDVKRGKHQRRGHETFWIVRKIGAASTVAGHDENPILTSYQMLWMDVREANPANIKIENTLRRILEHYFTILGSVDPNAICGMFGGQDQVICRSLFAWINAGSHDPADDLYVAPSEAMVQNYLRVFKAIFERTGNGGHYAMMMGEELMGLANLAPRS